MMLDSLGGGSAMVYLGGIFLALSTRVTLDTQAAEGAATGAPNSLVLTPFMRHLIVIEAMTMLSRGTKLRQFRVGGVIEGEVIRRDGSVTLGDFTGTWCMAEFRMLEGGGGKCSISFILRDFSSITPHLEDPVFRASLYFGDEAPGEVQARIDAAKRAEFRRICKEPHRYN
ncbi:hypothetical protein KBB27_01790 [Patescibacteria group bacterium]|nr:hypothetical protein [Patescibacteria group bacterium]